MRLATWNVNSVRARLPRLLGWLTDVRPDVVCLQETKCSPDTFPTPEVADLGYEVAVHGIGAWNGVAILSRVGLHDATPGFKQEPGFAAEPAGPAELAEPAELAGPAEPGAEPGPEARALGATCGGLRIWSLYVPNGRTPDSPHYAYKLRWFAALRDALATELAGPPLVICGDFNVAPADADVWDPALFAHSTHVTPAERAALADLRALGLRDVVPRPLKGTHPFTYWDYRAGMFHQDKGMRIDLVYAVDEIADRVQDAYVDREARKGKLPSDHAPIVVDLT
jgi:exodeoxyribonuclease-3